MSQLDSKKSNDGFLWVLEGDIDKGMKNAQNKHLAVYETAIAYHGCMEPMNCVVYEKDGIWHIHGANQSASFTPAVVGGAIGVDSDKVVCHHIMLVEVWKKR